MGKKKHRHAKVTQLPLVKPDVKPEAAPAPALPPEPVSTFPIPEAAKRRLVDAERDAEKKLAKSEQVFAAKVAAALNERNADRREAVGAQVATFRREAQDLGIKIPEGHMLTTAEDLSAFLIVKQEPAR